jgi:pyrrolysine biosynthesis protein PylD
MTRLRSTDIKHIGHTLNDYDASLLKKTGYPLRGIALQAAGISEKAMEEGLTAHRVAVVPIATGEGILEGFAEAVCQILSHLGAKAFITTGTDVQGFAEAMERGATVLFCADDDRFVALRFAPRKVVDNAEATARGFVTALDLMAGGLPGRKVLVIGGAGRVGWKATSLLKDKGAQISVFDIDQLRLETLARGNNIRVETKSASFTIHCRLGLRPCWQKSLQVLRTMSLNDLRERSPYGWVAFLRRQILLKNASL